MAVVEEVTEERGDGRVAELVARGNASYVDDEFAAACAAYSQALEAQGCSAKQTAQLYALRAQANLQLEDYVNAVSDANRAIEADPSLDKAYLRKVREQACLRAALALPAFCVCWWVSSTRQT